MHHSFLFISARRGSNPCPYLLFERAHSKFRTCCRSPFEKKDFQRLVRGNLFSKGVATGESWGAAAGGSITPNF